jgi:hypothetical protein
MGKPENVSLAVHHGEHEVDVPSLLEFFRKSLPEAKISRIAAAGKKPSP